MSSTTDIADRYLLIEMKLKESIRDVSLRVVVDVQFGDIIHLLNCILKCIPLLWCLVLHAAILKKALEIPIYASRNLIPSLDKANSIDHASSPARCLSGLIGQRLRESPSEQSAIPNLKPPPGASFTAMGQIFGCYLDLVKASNSSDGTASNYACWWPSKAVNGADMVASLAVSLPLP